MTRQEGQHLFTALFLAAAIGIFSCFGATGAIAQETTTETTEEQDTAAVLARLQELIASLSAALDAIQAELTVFRQEREDAQRKSLTLHLPLGLSRSTAEPFYSRIPGDDEVICTAIGCAPDGPLEDLLMFSAENRLFAPLTSTLLRTFSGDDRGSTRTDDFYVETISGDGSDGFNVTYVIDGEERSVQFSSDTFGTENCETCYYLEDGEGRRYWFWKSYETVDYADIHGGAFPGGIRTYFIFGARTETGNLPVGSASYFGRMYAEAYQQDDPDNDQRVEMDGRIVLTADLDESTLDGVIRALRSRPRGGQYSALSDTSAHFKVTGGRIVDGQFTATLTGMDNSVGQRIDDIGIDGETVRGYKGGILGEFYGPAAEEIGGVVSATSDVHNRVLAGYFSGEQLNSTSSDELPAQSTALFVDRPESDVSIIEQRRRDGDSTRRCGRVSRDLFGRRRGRDGPPRGNRSGHLRRVGIQLSREGGEPLLFPVGRHQLVLYRSRVRPLQRQRLGHDRLGGRRIRSRHFHVPQRLCGPRNADRGGRPAHRHGQLFRARVGWDPARGRYRH